MKKIVTLITCLGALLFTGCFSPVYHSILNDVPPEEAKVSGIIRNITRYNVDGKEFLVLISENGIEYKLANNTEHGAWKIYEKSPAKEAHHYDYYNEANHVGEQLLSTYADNSTLYIVSCSYKNNIDEGTAVPDTVFLYGKQISLAEDGETWASDGDWTVIIGENNSSSYFPIYLYENYAYSAFSVFGTNAVQNAHRKVFIRKGNADANVDDYKATSYYKLSGLNTPEEITVSPLDDTEKNNILSVQYFNGDYIFFNTIASTTNETTENDATVVYYGKEKELYYKTVSDSEFTKSEIALGQVVSCICACKDSLIIGRGDYKISSNTGSGGVVRVGLNDNGIPGSELISFTSNIETQLSASYFIFTLLNVDPAQTEDNSILYSSVGFIGTGTSASVKFKDVGLWAYYPVRKNWNRE